MTSITDYLIRTTENNIYPYFLECLDHIEQFMHEVLSNDNAAFREIEEPVVENNMLRIKKRLIELPLSEYFDSVIELLQSRHPDYKYSIHVILFFECCFELDLANEWCSDPLGYTTKTGKLAYELYNDLIFLIRRKSRSPAFKKLRYNRRYISIENYQSASKYVEWLFQKHSRLLVLRIDFSYQGSYAKSTSAEMAKADFDHFLNNYRHNQRLSEHRLGYIWTMEYGRVKGHHFHCIFFYNGADVRNDVYWSNELGKYWEKVTQGKGMHYNRNRDKADFERFGNLGMGMIHRNDTSLRSNLMRVVRYIVKPEQYLLAIQKDFEIRLFGKGNF